MDTTLFKMKKWYTCEKCAKQLSSYHSLWRHKKKYCRSSLYNVPTVLSTIKDRSPILSRSLNIRHEKIQDDEASTLTPQPHHLSSVEIKLAAEIKPETDAAVNHQTIIEKLVNKIENVQTMSMELEKSDVVKK